MNTPPQPVEETSPPAGPPEPTLSLLARLVNVFAVPGEVFDDVRSSRASAANWLVPALLTALVGTLAAIVMFSQPAIQQQVREQQEKAIEERVQAGKLSRAQADQALAVMERFTGPRMMIALGTLGAVVNGFVRCFGWGLVLWLLGRWVLKARFDYMKAVEVAGLAGMIAVLGALVTLLLIVNVGSLFSRPSLALAVEDFDVKKPGHLLLGAANLFTFWHVAVMSVGLARLAGVPWARALLIMFSFWLLWTLALVFSGVGQMAL